MRVIALLWALVACSHPALQIGVHGASLKSRLAQLGTDGSAEVVTYTSEGAVANRETVFLYQTVTYHGQTTTIAKVVAGCGPFAQDGVTCTLGDRELVVLRAAVKMVDTPPPASLDTSTDPTPHTNGENKEVARVSGALTLGFLAAVGICIGICGDEKLGVSLGLGAGALISAVVWAVASGGRD